MAKKIALVVLAGLVVLAVLNRSAIMAFFKGGQRTINRQEVKLLIPDGLSVDSLAAVLVEHGVIANAVDFTSEVEKQEVDSSAFDGGKYVILSGTTLSALVDGFTVGENGHGKAEHKVNVLFNRCVTIEDIGQNIGKCIQADSAAIVDYIQDENTLKQYAFTLEQIPALFLPDTYEMYYDTDAAAFVAFMAEQFRNFWTPERMEKLKAVGLSYPSQAATLASIVYAEQSKVSDEWPIIARLYLNRLSQGMKLQSDPTFKFCWGDELKGTRRLLAKHRAVNCAYNTYKIDGLPPGPIRIVPAKVIDAVLNPADVDYLFMCAKPDYSGAHDFTSSGSKHMENARVYQKWLRKEMKN